MGITLHELRQRIASREVGKSGLAADQNWKRYILEQEVKRTGDTTIASVLSRQDQQIAANQKKQHFAGKKSRRRSQSKRGTRRDYRSPEGFNQCGIDVGLSYASKAARKMEARLMGFPNVICHPSNVNISIHALNSIMGDLTALAKATLRSAFADLSDGSVAEGGLQIALHTAAYLSMQFPENEWPEGFDPVARPNELFAMLHWHGVICDPYLSKKSVRNILKQAFPGPNRVCVRAVIEEREDQHGQITHGTQGFLEYCMMDKTEVHVKGVDGIVEATIAHAKLAVTWTRQHRRTSFGKPLSETGIVIDPDRVKELEINERLEKRRKTWKQRCYAEQFIDLFLSGMIVRIQKPAVWVKMNGTLAERVGILLSIANNWFDAAKVDEIDFTDFFAASLE